LNAQKTELERYRFNIQHELEFAEHIFQNITSKGSINVPYLSFWTSSMSMSMFNGDLLLTARKPAGGLHILLCDFTGHGLPAAVGALPVSDVFTAMTDRGFSIADIVSEMNRKLKMELPTGFFCAAGFADVDVAQGTLSIWNGGLPEIYVYDSKLGSNHRIASNNLPLGVVDKLMDRGDVSVMEITQNLHLFMYTDGLIETVNENEDMFGAERLERCFREGENSQYFLRRVKEELAQFRGNALQHDDVSFFQLDCSAALDDVPEEVQPTAPQGVVPAEWEMTFDLSAGLLKDINPVPMMLNMLTHIRVPNEHRKRIFTVLTELYTNAMDHGLLQLESKLKNTPEGFKVFYEEREKRLATLTQGAAKITIEQVCDDGDYILKIRMSDTGSGFSVYDVIVAENEEMRKDLPSGRGIKLVRSLCRTLEYTNGGSTAEATYYMGEKS